MNFSKLTDYAAKDLLLHGDSAKAIKGTEIGAEFDAIAIMSATKIDSGGALGTPSSGTLTNCTGLPVSSGVSGLGTGVAAAIAGNIGSAGAPVLFNGAGGTPSSLTLTNATGLPSSVVTGLTAGKAQQVDQAVAATIRATITDLTGQSLEGTLSNSGVAITAFHGVAGVTYKRKCLGAGNITAGAGLTILQGGVTITTAAGDTFEVYMLTATTCEVRNYVRAAAPSGRVLQTVNTQSIVQAETTNTAMQDSGLGLSITPKYASSKLLVAFSIAITIPDTSTAGFMALNIVDGEGVSIYTDSRALAAVSGVFVHGRFSGEVLIDAASTASRRYFVSYATSTSGQACQINHASFRTSSITIQELAQ